jgi:hypothetical protein
MAHKSQGAMGTLDEIQSSADRLAGWIQKNLVLVSSAIVGLLVLAGAAAMIARADHAQEEKASTALAEVRAAYFEAMGAAPGAIEVPELANAAAAERIRTEYRQRFSEVGEEYEGTVSGALALLEAAELATQAGDSEAADGIYQAVLDEGAGGDRLRGLVLQHTAQSLEREERWADAAERHEQASKLDRYPLRDWALADAARCRAQAGDREAAAALYATLDERAPELRLPDYLRSQKRELEAATQL